MDSGKRSVFRAGCTDEVLYCDSADDSRLPSVGCMCFTEKCSEVDTLEVVVCSDHENVVWHCDDSVVSWWVIECNVAASSDGIDVDATGTVDDDSEVVPEAPYACGGCAWG